MLEKTLESLLDSKEIQPVRPKGDQSWVFIGRTDVEAETPIFWPPDVKNWLIWNDPDIGKDWRQEKKGTTEEEMVGWHHQHHRRVWASSESWWWTGRPRMLQSMESQRVSHDWATELHWYKSIYLKVNLNKNSKISSWKYYFLDSWQHGKQWPGDFKSWRMKT